MIYCGGKIGLPDALTRFAAASCSVNRPLGIDVGDSRELEYRPPRDDGIFGPDRRLLAGDGVFVNLVRSIPLESCLAATAARRDIIVQHRAGQRSAI